MKLTTTMKLYILSLALMAMKHGVAANEPNGTTRRLVDDGDGGGLRGTDLSRRLSHTSPPLVVYLSYEYSERCLLCEHVAVHATEGAVTLGASATINGGDVQAGGAITLGASATINGGDVQAGGAITVGAGATIDDGAVQAGGAITVGAGAFIPLEPPLKALDSAEFAAAVLAKHTAYTADDAPCCDKYDDYAPMGILLGGAMEACSNCMADEMGGLTFTPGTYRAGGAINVALGTGGVTLDAQGDPNRKFIFISDTTLTLGADTSINLINQARAENVVWALGGAAALGANSVLEGSIIAAGAIALGAGSKLHGCALTTQGAVTAGALGSVSLVDPFEKICYAPRD